MNQDLTTAEQQRFDYFNKYINKNCDTEFHVIGIKNGKKYEVNPDRKSRV